MAKTRAQKRESIKDLTEGFKTARLIVISSIKGLNVSDTNELRSNLRKEKIFHKVAKIRLLERALKKVGIKVGSLKLQTQIAVSYSEDETAPARELKKFSEKHKNLQMLCGFLNGEYLKAGEIAKLADIPSRTELLGSLVAALSGPARNLASVLQGNLRGLVRVLSQAKK